MATFQTRIEDLIGSVGDTAAESDWLTEGARIVADTIKRTSPNKLILYATDKTDTDGTTGIAITGGIPLSAHASGYGAIWVPVSLSAAIADSDSIHYATARSPKWYYNTSKGYVKPSGGVIKWFGYPTVAYGDSTISNYPSEAYNAIVLYAAILGQMRIISDLITTTLGGVTFDTVSTISAPAAPSFSWTDATLANYISTSLGVTATPPTYTKPTFGGSFTNMASALTNHDADLAQAEGQQINLYLNEYSQDIQNELNEYNKEFAAYEGKIKQEIEQAELTSREMIVALQAETDLNKFNELQTLNEQVQEYQAVLGKHQSDVANYGAQVNAEAQKTQSEIQQYISMYQGYLELLKHLKEEFKTAVSTL